MTDHIVRRLVEHGLAVFEIACEEQTLESFYLALMKTNLEGVKPLNR